MQYRPDIDGLRAVAILAVVGCHAGAPGFGGGFVGVDVFFVISGFLITSLLVKEQKEAGRIDIRAFYARRVRRLVPALALVLTCTILAGFFLASADGEQQTLAQSAIAVSTFVSNLYFGLSRLGYFLPSGHYLPLLHTWSLGVEEQFYLVWPLVMIAGAFIGRRSGLSTTKVLGWLLALGSLISIALCFLLLDKIESLAFYSFPTRAWELGAGALLALLAPALPRRRPLGAMLAALGCLFIGAVVLHQPTNIFTAAPAVIAVAGAVLVIAGGIAAPNATPVRLLGAAPMVMIGKLSYSWYLWHWVLLAFARGWAAGTPSLARDLAMVALALGLAALTWVFIEQPARRQKVWLFATDARSLKAGAAILAACAGLAVCLWLWGDYRLTRDPNAQMAVAATQSRILLSEPCENARSLDELLAANCTIGTDPSQPLLVVLGDSHARHLIPGLAEIARAKGVRLLPAVKSSCLVFPYPETRWAGILERRQERCARFHDSVLRGLPALQAQHGAVGVIIAGRWQRDRMWESSLPRYVQTFSARGLRTVLVSDIPGYPYSVPRCVAHKGVENCRSHREQVERSHERDLAVLQQLACADSDVVVVDPLDALCTPTRCEVAGEGGLLYTDANHLSPAGSMRVGRLLAPAIDWLSDTPAKPAVSSAPRDLR